METSPKYSFKKVGTTKNTEPTPTAAVEAVAPYSPAISGTALPPPEAAAMTRAPYERRSAATYGDDSDSIGIKDVNMPRLNIVQKVGDLSNVFTEGAIVFNGELVLLESPKSDKSGKALKIIVAGFRADRFVQKTVGGAQGDIVDTEEQVFKKGGTTDYNEAAASRKPYYQTLAECLIIIEKPEEINDPSFKYFINGKAYAPALWSQKGTAYTNATKVFRTARKNSWLCDEYNPDGTLKAKRGYPYGTWELRTQLKDFSGNFAWIPVLRRGEVTTPEMQEFAASLMGK